MTNEYLKRNALGYEGDTFIHGEIEKLVKKFSIDSIIETGTYRGATTKRLAEFAIVRSIECDPSNYATAKANLANYAYAEVIQGNSGEILNKIVGSDKTLYFLDAHWHDAWPLLDELKQIKSLGIKPVIIIHDFKVPGKDFGFDSYKGVPLDFDYVKAGIESIYGPDGYDYHYNDQADGAARGVIYIYPKVLPVYKLVLDENEDHGIKGIVLTDKPLCGVGFISIKNEKEKEETGE